jgi:hypothetical protein
MEYSYSLLSEAAYADLRNKIDSDDIESALVSSGFSQSQAEDFVTHWRVAHHLPNTNTGFSATVFESIDNPGEYVFAMR